MLVAVLIMLRVTDPLEYPVCFSCDENNSAKTNATNLCTCTIMNKSKLTLSTNENILTFHFYYNKSSCKGGAIVLNSTVIVPVFGVACNNSYGEIRI